MKITGYLSCVLLLACLAKSACSEDSQNKVQQQFFDALNSDEPIKMKRPFCNAFTGCGKKRSLYENAGDAQDLEPSSIVRLPVSVYKALLRAASQNLRNSIGRTSNNYQLSGEVPQVYFSRKIPLQ